MSEKEILKEPEAISSHADYTDEIIALIKSNLTPKLKNERISDYHEKDIATAMDNITPEERKKLYSVLSTSELAGVLEYSELINEYIDELPIVKKIEVLSKLEPSVTVEYLRLTDKQRRQNLLDLMPEELKAEIKLLDSFDEDEIGSKMSTNYIVINSGLTVKQAMSSLIGQAAECDNISTLYVVDGSDTLVGAIELKDLIIARENTDLESITVTSYPYVYASEKTEDCLERLKDYSENSIPVLDSENRLKGVLLLQDIARLSDDEMEDDYAKLAGLSAEEDINEPTKKSIGKRLPWLAVLLGLGLLVSTVVGVFEEIVSNLPLIVCFQSLILAMAGNAGTQSLAVTIRVLADDTIAPNQKIRLIFKETKIGLVNGSVLALLSVVFIGAYMILLKSQDIGYSFAVSACAGAALLISVVISSVTGTVIPICLKKFGIDPAAASGPMITTVNDLIAVIAYYGTAWLLIINVFGY